MGIELKDKVSQIRRVHVQFVNAVDDHVELRVDVEGHVQKHVYLRVSQEKLIEMGAMESLRRLDRVADYLEANKELVVELVDKQWPRFWAAE